MLPTRSTFGVTLALVALLWGAGALGPSAHAQAPRYSLALRGVPLDDALQRFVDATDIAVAYDPRLVQGHRTYCAAEDRPAEDILQCILKDSGLDYIRLSSGTYVLTAPAETAPQPGYLSGTVTDRQTSAPLAHAHVQLLNADRGTTTNRAGRFVFPSLLPGRYAVRVTHLGYRPWTDTLRVTPDARTHAQATLRTEPIFITPVVVDGLHSRATAGWARRNRVDASSRAIGRAAGSPAAYRGLNALSGVRLNDVTADVHLQGSAPGDHQLRLDGVPVHLPRTTLGLIGPFSAFALDRVTVRKAGFDAAHGSQSAGVIAAEHALASESSAHLQVDPLSVDGRVQWAPATDGPTAIAAMGAARIGLWRLYEPPRLHGVLEAWSAPDPFLLRPYTDSLAGDFPFVPSSATDPTAHFADVHAAARFRPNPLRTVTVSGYRGQRRLTGGVLSDGTALSADESGRALFTTTDDYRWTNTLGQVSYDAVWGDRTLLSAQLRASQYDLAHRYDILDSLIVEPTPGGARVMDRTTLSLEDGNRVQTAALEGTVDHARGDHQLRAGVQINWTDSAFDLYGVRFKDSAAQAEFESALTSFGAAPPRRVGHEARRGRLSGFASDTWALTNQLQTTLGVRLTYLPDRATVYAEPRLALRFDQSNSALGPWSMRTAAGLYRQFTYQTDVSVLNAGALLPSTRIWLPLDASVRPPRTYHLSHAMVWRPIPSWRIEAEGYAKFHPHRLAMKYAPATQTPLANRVNRQDQFLVGAQGRSLGGSVSVEWNGSGLRTRAQYAYSHATQQRDAFFAGRRVPSPWTEPHRVELGFDWMPTNRLTASLRGRGVWNRPWGFRRAYYDYFGHPPATQTPGSIDLSRPADHVLPPLVRFDVSLAYTRALGPASVQARLDVRNVTGRDNVADWRLVRTEDGTWERSARTLYPRTPSVALRVNF